MADAPDRPPRPVTQFIQQQRRGELHDELLADDQLDRPHGVVLAVLEGIATRLGEQFPHVYMGTAAR